MNSSYFPQIVKKTKFLFLIDFTIKMPLDKSYSHVNEPLVIKI